MRASWMPAPPQIQRQRVIGSVRLRSSGGRDGDAQRPVDVDPHAGHTREPRRIGDGAELTHNGSGGCPHRVTAPRDGGRRRTPAAPNALPNWIRCRATHAYIRWVVVGNVSANAPSGDPPGTRLSITGRAAPARPHPPVRRRVPRGIPSGTIHRPEEPVTLVALDRGKRQPAVAVPPAHDVGRPAAEPAVLVEQNRGTLHTSMVRRSRAEVLGLGGFGRHEDEMEAASCGCRG